MARRSCTWDSRLALRCSKVSLKAARAAGGDLRITDPNEQVKSVLRLTNLSRVLLVHPDADAPFD